MVELSIELVIFVALLVHGIGHGAALATLGILAFRPAIHTGNWKAARSWLLPSLPGSAATALASALWIVSLVGFLAVALSWWGRSFPTSGGRWASWLRRSPRSASSCSSGPGPWPTRPRH